MMVDYNPNKYKYNWKIGDNFDIIIGSNSIEYPIWCEATFTKKGAIVILPSASWNLASFADMVWVASHESDHIGIGQLMGIKVSIGYDMIIENIREVGRSRQEQKALRRLSYV